MGSPTGLMYQAAKWILKGCGCFTPETRVWTATGLVAIALIQPGDMVFALDETSGETSLRMVTEVYEREGDAPLVIVHVSSGERIETTEEHPFLVSGRWVRADRLSRGDELDGAFGCVSVVAVEHTSRLSRVHNLEVEGLHNYRVGPDGVVVHNGDPCSVIARWLKESGGSFVRGKNLDDLEHILDDLVKHDGWKKSTARSGNGVRWVEESGNKSIRFHPGGSQFDADHFYGRPYWVWSDGTSLPGEIKYEAR